MKQHNCRFCNTPLTKSFLDLGMSPLSNSFLNSEELNNVEHLYPLHAFVCEKCFLVQLEEFESPEHIFSDYAYFSSFSVTWLKHAEDYVNKMINRFGFNQKNQIVEIASNDGYLLQYFQERKIPILGIEPAANVARVAEQKGIPTVNKFFGVQTAKELASTGKQADLLLGNNVLAHVPNLNDFVAGMKILLKPNGIITMEFPHLLNLIQQNQFDTIYHEHFSYFSLLTVKKVFSAHGLTVFDVEELTTHGGSLRIYAKHEENHILPIKERVNKLEIKERHFRLDNISTYTNFQERVEMIKYDICDFFTNARNNGKRIAGYGAAAKGNTLLNYCEIGTNFIEYMVDRNQHKQNLFLPGTHIPIKPPEKIKETKPDYLIILPWNLRDEIMMQMDYIRSWGGKFVVLIPKVEVY